MNKTNHARKIQQQRCIKDKTIGLLMTIGNRFKKGDVEIICFPRTMKDFLEKKYPKIKNISKAYLVMSRRDGAVITVGHQYKNH